MNVEQQYIKREAFIDLVKIYKRSQVKIDELVLINSYIYLKFSSL